MSNCPKYGRITTELKDIPEDEPVFLLRGQDVLAVENVLYYADAREAVGHDEAALEIRELAARMANWRPRRIPD